MKVSPAPKVATDQIGSYAVSPFGFKAGRSLSGAEERQLAAWVTLNRDVLLRYWDGEIEYTEDALAKLRPI